MRLLKIIVVLGILSSCDDVPNDAASNTSSPINPPISQPYLVVLGTVQDAGSPHIACQKSCCKDLFLNPDKNRKVVSLGLVDPENKKSYLFEATPDMPEQMKFLKQAAFSDQETPDGIFLTHAHIGHYTGLMYLGKEAMNADGVPVFAMPKMKAFLEQNGPWSQLVKTENISIREMTDMKEVELTSNLIVIPFTVPHRDEYSETVGFKIVSPNKSVLFIPDIDKWEKWEKSIIDEIAKVDYVFVDATFYNGQEINNRNISEVPHPAIVESMKLFKDLPIEEKNKVNFIHFNHTNPALVSDSKQSQLIVKNGFKIARIHDVIEL